jgi:hypothetical protein
MPTILEIWQQTLALPEPERELAFRNNEDLRRAFWRALGQESGHHKHHWRNNRWRCRKCKRLMPVGVKLDDLDGLGCSVPDPLPPLLEAVEVARINSARSAARFDTKKFIRIASVIAGFNWLNDAEAWYWMTIEATALARLAIFVAALEGESK